ncbi:MAG: RecQ family ATP-dependent DNA helicase [Bacteroidales bacterium]|jgi:ATP-dependent DNA helicase RecQ|nr:RecQ family ATP-dependent DNA helicase [Bacteroidales bacterium]
MTPYESILYKYWNFAKFRPLQQEIIESVCAGRDTLALMPTGGGKSITFQVAALSKEGICIVITPLIALMKDQVDNLKNKGIKALAIYSGLSAREIDIALDNCIYGGVKFLYVSPERLQTPLFVERVQRMNLCLIAVDEAHCISQWGYDFRPSYMHIPELRTLFPEVPILALTATATPQVALDIQNKLEFRAHNVLSKSFERKNLTYMVKEREDKIGYILQLCAKIRGAGIVYVRTRKQTKEMAYLLQKAGVNADYYHAGLDGAARQAKQEAWTKSPNMVMVSTNAFGMGIDKPNVRFVLHIDVPESLEAYFQEAGRAGRDEKEAFAVLLFNRQDITTIRTNFTKKYPDYDYIKKVYEALGNYLQVPEGDGKGRVFDFFIADFCAKFHLEIVMTFNSLKMLEDEGYIVFSDSAERYARAKFLLNRNELYKFQVENRDFDAIVKLILRSYEGIFTDFVTISEEALAKKAATTPEVIMQYLIALAQRGIIAYYKAKQNPIIVYSEERLPLKNLLFSYENIAFRKEQSQKRIHAMIEYVQNNAKCRSLQLLEYFGETAKQRCGNCDVCRKRNQMKVNKLQFDYIINDIKKLLADQSLPVQQLIAGTNYSQEDVLEVINFLLENQKMIYTGSGVVAWNK